MIVRTDISSIFKRVTLGFASFALVLGSVSAAVPVFLTQQASAVASVDYSNLSLTGWTKDRTAPSGGTSVHSFAGRDALELRVDNTLASPNNGFYRTEGVYKAISPSASIAADLYIDSAWMTDDINVRAGLWGVGQDLSGATSAYPILEFTNTAEYTGWRLWDSESTGGWTNLPGVSYATGWNNLELTLNNEDNTKVDVYANGSIVGASNVDPTVSIKSIILNSYNYATTVDKNYAVNWSNIQIGNQKTSIPTNVKFVKGSTEVAANSTVNAASNAKAIELRWQSSGAINQYSVKVTYPDTSSEEHWTSAKNLSIGQTVYNTRQFGLKGDGVYSYSVKARSSTTNLWSVFSNPISLTYDNTKPEAVIVNQTTTPVNNLSAALQVKATDTIAVNKVVANIYKEGVAGVFKPTQASASGAADFTHNVSLAGLASGNYTVKFNATDLAGNVSKTTTYRFTIDNDAPATPENLTVKAGTLSLTNPARTNSETITTSWDVVSDAVKYEYSISNDISNTTHTEYLTINSRPGEFNLGEGTHVIQVRAIDASGNASAWTTPFTVTYDKTAPVVNLSQDVKYATEGMVFNLMGTIADDVELNGWRYQVLDADKKVIAGAVGYSRMGGTVAVTDGLLAGVNLAGLADGTYYVRAWAFDKAGNRTGSVVVPNITKFVIYRSHPVVTINSTAADNALPIISGKVTEGATIGMVTVDGEQLVVTQTADVWSAPVTVPLGNGIHSVVVTGNDVAGNGFTTETTPTEFTTKLAVAIVPVQNPDTPVALPAAVVAPQPLAQNVAAQVATTTTETTTSEGEVLGTSTVAVADDTDFAGVQAKNDDVATTDASSDGFNAAWFWLLTIPAAGSAWWAFAAFRNRNS